ncbi:hypothetical protein GCM10022294_11290 [Dietzia aurantiaca]
MRLHAWHPRGMTTRRNTNEDEITDAVDAATVPEPDVLERARMIIVDKLGEWDSLGLDELVESVCEAYEAPSGEPLRVADVNPDAPDTNSPALRNLRYARAARTAVIALIEAGTIVPVAALDEDTALVGEGSRTGTPPATTPTATTQMETTDSAARQAGTDEVLVSVGPLPEGRRFALATS